MKALTIELQDKPKNLEKMLNGMHAFKKISDFVWKWESNLGNIRVVIDESSSLVKISADDNPPIVEERINKLAGRIQEQYKSCKIKYNPKFYTL